MPDARDIGIRQSFQSSLLGVEKLEMSAGIAVYRGEKASFGAVAAVSGRDSKSFPNKRKGPLRMAAALWKLLFRLFANFLLCPLASQSLLYAELRARLQIVGMTLDFLNDVFRLNFALEATQGALNGLAFLQSNFSQTKSPPNPAIIGHA